MSIIVTGGAGFIGSNFVRRWLSQKISQEKNGPVIVLDKLTYAGSLKNLENLNSNQMVFVQGDINDHVLVQDLFLRYNPQALLNFAAETHVDRSINDPEEFIKTNVNGTFNLLQCANTYYQQLGDSEKKTFRFLQVSTDEVYGSLDENQEAFTESSPYLPNNPYAASKASADHLVRSYYHTFGLPVLITHCSNNFGPNQHNEKLIPKIISNAINEVKIPIYGDGKNIRDWIYVREHCDAILAVLEKGKVGESYNIGSSNEKNNLEMTELICKMLDEISPRKAGGSYREFVTLVEDRPGHDRRYAINSSKLCKDTGFVFSEDFHLALMNTIRFYLERR